MDVKIAKLTNKERKEFFEFCIGEKRFMNNLLKLSEECTEVAQVAIKGVTKSKGVNKEELVEELGDLLLRVRIVAKQMEIGKDVIERYESKMAFLYDKMNKGELDIPVITREKSLP